MTQRGRTTLWAGAALVAASVLWLVLPPGLLGWGRAAVPDASAAPPPARALPSPPAALFARLPVTREVALEAAAPAHGGGDRDGHGLREWVTFPEADPQLAQPLRVDYTLDAELTRHVFDVLKKGRVELGHVIVLDPKDGRVLAYASTDIERFPPTRAYPAASLVKVVTAAAALDRDPGLVDVPCRYTGSPYRLTRSRLDPPKVGTEVTLERALATSNNQCFAQLAVHSVGGVGLMDAISRFGWLAAPAPAHAAGQAQTGEDRYDIGRLGCGLAGSRITPLHAAQLAGVLADGELMAPRWIDRVVDSNGRELPLPAQDAPRQVLTRELAGSLREMLVQTTRSGTARRAFRKRNGRPLLGSIQVAGKTGSLSGVNPNGRYEWFAGLAPADEPTIAVAVLLVQGNLWWRNAGQIAAEVLRGVFCENGACRPEASAPLRGEAEAPDSQLETDSTPAT